MTILLIEDDTDNLTACRKVLEHSGLEVLHACDGETGTRIARERGPVFILLDLTMPERDALQIVRRLQADPATSAIPVVALTPGDEVADRKRAREAGCHGYLPKSRAPEIGQLRG